MKNRHRLLTSIISLGMLVLPSCSSFFGGNEPNAIEDVVASYDSVSGSTTIVITFTNGDDPLTFVIPKGEEGVGITDVTAVLNENSVTLSLQLSNGESKSFDVPVIEGRGIDHIEIDEDDFGNTTLQFIYTDGTNGEIITIPKPNGIINVESTEPDENGDFVLTIYFTDGTSQEVPMHNGIDGERGADISSITATTDEENVILTITYSDGFMSTVSFPKAENGQDGTYWFSGTSDPNTQTLSPREGDFYLNKSNGNVYQYSNGQWQYLFCMKPSSSTQPSDTYCELFFDPGEGTIEGKNPGEIANISVKYGEKTALDRIPVPTLEGYTFNGWYTDLENPNAGQFTDLVTVTSDLNLYARYTSL